MKPAGVGIEAAKYKFWKGVSEPWTLKLVLCYKMAWGWVFVGGDDFLSLFVCLFFPSWDKRK